MSLNQSKSEKNESQFRKPGGGRSGGSGQQRNYAGGSGKGGGGGSTAPPPSTQTPSLSANRSFKKTNHVQSGQQKVTSGSLATPESNAAGRSTVQNGAHSQSAVHVRDAPAPTPSATAKSDIQRNTKPIPKAPSSQSPPQTSDAAAPPAPAKGDGGRGIPLQFGSISPAFMNGMQVPARTTSAPPNLDEQKRDQARREALIVAPAIAPAIPVPSPPKPQVAKKDVSHPTVHPSTGERNQELRLRREGTHVTPATVTSASLAVQQKPAVLPMSGGPPVPLHFSHQPPVSMQFGGPSPQIQSQGIPSSSHPMPMQMPMTIGNASQLQQQVFIPGFQHHIMPPQGLIHQGFSPPMGPQMPHLGGLGMNMPPPYSPPQPMNYSSGRKNVKITHPDTHEELRLDKKTDVYIEGSGLTVSRPLTGVSSQPQSLPSYNSPHSVNYYSNSYTGGPPVFPPLNSVPLTSPQLNAPAQTSRLNYSSSQAHPVPHTSQFAPGAVVAVNPSNKEGVSHGPTITSNSNSPRAVLNTTHTASVQGATKPVISSADTRAFGPSKVCGASALSPDPKKDLNSSGENQLKSSSFHSETSVTASSVVQGASIEKAPSSNSASSAKPSSTGINLETGPKIDSSGGTTNIGDVQLLQQVITEASLVSCEAGDGADPRVLGSDETKNDNSTSPEAPSKSSNRVTSIELGGTDVDGVVESRASVTSESISTGDKMESAGDGYAFLQDKDSLRAEELNAKDESKPLTNGLGEVDSSSCVKDADRRDQSADLKARGLETGTLEAHHNVVDTATSHIVGPLASNVCTVSDGENEAMPKDSLKESDRMGLNQEREDREPSRPASSSGSRPSSSSGSRPSSSSGIRPTSSSGYVSSSNRLSSESSRSKGSLAKGKKKKKEIYMKADAQGATSDLYTAYKGPEEKKETPVVVESKTLINDMKPASKGDSFTREDDKGKGEPDDWEDAAEISTPKLESSGGLGQGPTGHHSDDNAGARKYSRDFLLTLSEQCTDLPAGLGLLSDIADLLQSTAGSVRVNDRDLSSPGRVVDRSSGPRNERRGGAMMDVGGRWGKNPGGFPPGREMGPDSGYGGNVMGFRPGQGGHSGVLRHPRPQQSAQYPILSGPAQSVPWRNVSSKGLIPPPQAPSMHKAEKRYEVGKVADEEEAKQRRLKGILNKLTPQNFEKLFIQVKEVNIDNAVTLTGVISQIFDKALMEPTFCEMYADFCSHLASDLPELTIEGQKITFKRLLLNKCQEEFERGEREEAEANKDDSTDEPLSKKAREEMRLQVRRRMLGNIRLIGELYKKRMLTERIMHECIKKLLGDYSNPDEENIEALCKLLSTIGKMIDHSKAKDHMDAYFRILTELSNNMKLSSRVRFMLKDVIDLRRSRWEQRRKVDGPKKIEDVHKDAQQEKQAQSSRLNRGPSMNYSGRRGQPMDYGGQGSMMSSPAGHMGSFRGLPSQPRNSVMQDVRTDDRGSFENRVSLTLPQRSSNDDAITLGPQGGLARRMSVRGQPTVSNMPSDISQSPGDLRGSSGSNSFNSGPDRPQYNSRDPSNQSRYNPARFGGSAVHDQPSAHDRGAALLPSLDRHTIGAVLVKEQELPSTHNASSDERLKEMSIAAIREYYSAKDENEVTMCVRDLNAPGFYPTVISTWVSDSFERKDLERELLTKLIIKLSHPKAGIFVPDHLMKGFESVLSGLEDAINDAPRAPEFLGRLFAKVITEDLVSLNEVGRLLYEGGPEPGYLKEAGLAGDVLGSVLEAVKSEKGQAAAEEIRAKSQLRLEDFRPPEPLKSRKLELFI